MLIQLRSKTIDTVMQGTSRKLDEQPWQQECEGKS